MAETGIFISSCSRREWSRRRPGRSGGMLLSMLVLAVVVLALLAIGFGAVAVARGGI